MWHGLLTIIVLNCSWRAFPPSNRCVLNWVNVTGLLKSLNADGADLAKTPWASGTKQKEPPAETKQGWLPGSSWLKKNISDEGENVTRSLFPSIKRWRVMVSSLRVFSFLLLPEYVCRDALMGIFYQTAGKVKSFSPQSLSASERAWCCNTRCNYLISHPPSATEHRSCPCAAAGHGPVNVLHSVTAPRRLAVWQFCQFPGCFLMDSFWILPIPVTDLRHLRLSLSAFSF